MAPSEMQRRLAESRAAEGPGPLDATSQHRRRNDESWVEVSSQPSSSSLSSIGDEIVTTGLHVSGAHPQRRRRLQQMYAVHNSNPISQQVTQAGTTSSQEEYDETESEEDHVLTSSTENMQSPAASEQRSSARQQQTPAVELNSESDDDDENATALGRVSDSPPSFRPQPNAFSHPPSHLTHRHSTSSTSSPHHRSFQRPSFSNRSQTQGRAHRNAPNFMSPCRADNDEALRASLSTLLSYATAARGLPKQKEDKAAGAGPVTSGPSVVGPGLGPSTQPMEFRLVPESELMTERPGSAHQAGQGPVKARNARVTSNNSTRPVSSVSSKESADAANREKGKRSAAQAKTPRATKKKRTSSTATAVVDGETTTLISPTLLTWVVSAGVVVLVSVVGFGAGYVIGREVGRQEGMGMGMSGGNVNASTVADGTSCGRELVRSSSGGTLRRFRWGGMGKSIAA